MTRNERKDESFWRGRFDFQRFITNRKTLHVLIDPAMLDNGDMSQLALILYAASV